MTIRHEMLGAGFSTAQADRLGLTTTAITAAGSASASATLCGLQTNVFVVTGTGTDGIRMNPNTPLLTPIYVCNTSGSNCLVYPSTGGAVNGGSTDAGETCATTTVQIWIRISTNVWAALLGA